MISLHDLFEGNHWVTFTKSLTVHKYIFCLYSQHQGAFVVSPFHYLVGRYVSPALSWPLPARARRAAWWPCCLLGGSSNRDALEQRTERCQEAEQLLTPARHPKSFKLWWEANPTREKICVLFLSPHQSRDGNGSLPCNSIAIHFTNMQM